MVITDCLHRLKGLSLGSHHCLLGGTSPPPPWHSTTYIKQLLPDLGLENKRSYGWALTDGKYNTPVNMHASQSLREGIQISLLGVENCDAEIHCLMRQNWRALFQNVLSANPKIEVAMAMPSSKIMLWKGAVHKYVHIYALIHMWKAL